MFPLGFIFNLISQSYILLSNTIAAGELENQDRRGGGGNPCFMSKYEN